MNNKSFNGSTSWKGIGSGWKKHPDLVYVFVGPGMYGHGNNQQINNAYQMPISYQYGGGVGGSQADEVR